MIDRVRRPAAFLIALMIVAANLRPTLTGVGPLLLQIQRQLSLSATAAGLLNSLPILMFAAAAPLARFAGQHGAERLMLLALLTLAAGILLRSEGQVVTLFAGTIVLSSGIAVANILMPILIKQHYPDRIPTLTTAYATMMAGLAGLASGISVPLARVLPGEWRGSLAFWVLPAMLAILLWLPHLRPVPHAPEPTDRTRSQIWRTALGWQVTVFMGLQSAIFFTSITWIPTIVADAGFSPDAAGWLLTVYQFVGLLAGLAVPLLIRRFADQRLLAFCLSIFAACGSLGMLFAPGAAVLWAVVFGLGAGPCLILALSFMGLRARDRQSAAALSLMAQAIGYLIAAGGPVAFGYLHDRTGGWSAPLLCVALLGVLQGVAGLGAGRNRKV